MLQQLRQFSQFHVNSIKKAKELYLKEAEFYELFFSYLALIEQKTSEIQVKIRLYNAYQLGTKCKYTKYSLPVGYIIMVIFGLIIPLYLLSPIQKIGLTDINTASVITGALFLISAAVTGISTYIEIRQ